MLYGGQKIYDAVTEDDEPSYSSSSSSTLSSAKSTRTKLRKKLIREAILENRKSLISRLLAIESLNLLSWMAQVKPMRSQTFPVLMRL